MELYPAPTLVSERLMLRHPVETDIPLVLEAQQESWEQFSQIFAWAKGDQPTTDHGPRRFILESITLWQQLPVIPLEDYVYQIFSQTTGRYLGPVGFSLCGPNHDEVELGYWMRLSEQGNGYMSEAVRCLTDHLLDDPGIRQVLITGDADNASSRRIAEKAGFRFVKEGLNLSFRVQEDPPKHMFQYVKTKQT